MNHTKEPWKADLRSGCFAIYPNGQDRNCLDGAWDDAIVYQNGRGDKSSPDGYRYLTAEQEANAKRIVACVNACADVEDDCLVFGYVKWLQPAEQEANAKRIAACVNACADVEDDCLDFGYVKWLQQRSVELELSVMNLEEENARMKDQLTWRPVSELPEKDQIVVATYLNCYGKRRRVRAVYVRQYEEEAGDDELCVEYCEEKDEWYLKEGWYELIDNLDYSLAAIVEGVVDYWMPMPPAPEGEKAT